MESKNNSSGQYATSGQTETENQSGGLNMGNITDMLGGLNIPDALKKCSGTATKAISGMSTTQKVIGGALLLLGATYLSRKSKGGRGLLSKVGGSLGKMNQKKNSR